jgi:hypothetical protein
MVTVGSHPKSNAERRSPHVVRMPGNCGVVCIPSLRDAFSFDDAQAATSRAVRLVAIALFVALPASAATVSLSYRAPPECPDEATLRQLVAARLGNDPFVAEAPSRVSIQVVTPTQAEVVLESPGTPTRRKSLTAQSCTELLQSVAVTVALVVDPLIKKPEPEAPPRVTEPEPKPAPPPSPPVAEVPAATPLRWRISAGATVNGGLAVGPQPVLRLAGRVHGEVWSLGLEGRFAWPVLGQLAQGALSTSAILGAVVPCLHWKWLAGCADVSLGGLRLEGSALANATAATVFHASAGLRALLTLPVTERFAVSLMLEGQVPFTRARALVGSETVWAVWPVGFGGGAWLSWLL